MPNESVSDLRRPLGTVEERVYREIERCRACGNGDLKLILSLGHQALTGVFPKTASEGVPAGPLELVKCDQGSAPDACGLVQLRQSYRAEQMYGARYGYRSGLNSSMVAHLNGKVDQILKLVPWRAGDLVIDIGSNDGTLLRRYPKALTRLGIDPTGEYFRRHYQDDSIHLICDFFSAKAVRQRFDRQAKIITSIAMFYDLEKPLEFMREVGEVLADDGIWVFEQSYLPSMLKANAYDTICHEHIEYYALSQVQWMARETGLKIVDVEVNAVNGGSFSVVCAKAGSPLRPNQTRIDALLAQESELRSMAPFDAFRDSVLGHRHDLIAFFDRAAARKQTILGYGASTKGNVILQFCGLGREHLPMIGEVNSDKFGCFTPGTRIPIVPESEVKAARPDYLLILPWHFKDFILEKESEYRSSGGKLFFPLPSLKIH